MAQLAFMDGSNQTFDTSIRVAEVGQVVIYKHAVNRRFVIHQIEETDEGIIYYLVDTVSHVLKAQNILFPLSQDYGYGFYYYDDQNPEFLPMEEVEELYKIGMQKQAQADEYRLREERRMQEKAQREEKPANGIKTAQTDAEPGVYDIVNYSRWCIAVFGDTKPIKDKLHAMEGKFNKRLTYKGVKPTPGWVFKKEQEQEVRDFLNSL